MHSRLPSRTAANTRRASTSLVSVRYATPAWHPVVSPFAASASYSLANLLASFSVRVYSASSCTTRNAENSRAPRSLSTPGGEEDEPPDEDGGVPATRLRPPPASPSTPMALAT